MRLPRITTRRWMVAMAIAAVVLGAERMWQRWAALRRRAADHEATSSVLALIRYRGEYPYCSLGIHDIPLVYNSEKASIHAACVLYHTRMLRKYRLAMLRPWLPVEPDPPGP